MADQQSFAVSNPAGYAAPHALFFGALGAPATAVTDDTPLPIRMRGARDLSLIERLNREGEPTAAIGNQAYTSFAVPTGAGTAMAAPFAPPAPGRALYVKSLHVFSTTPITGRMQVGNGSSDWPGTGTQPLLDIGVSCGPTLACPSIPVDVFLRSSDRLHITAYINRWLDPAVSGTHYVGVGGTGFTLADSINFEARKVILMIGDSTWNGTGPTTVDTCVPWLINRFYRDAGVDCRYILKAYSGTTTGGHEAFRKGGKYDFERVDAIFYNLGINDAGQAVPTATSIANLEALVAWKQTRYPAAKLVIFGTTPVQTAAQEAGLAALRTAQAARVAQFADSTVLYCTLGASFDRTIGANYVATDGADGTRVHPADAGLTQLWGGGYAGNAGLRAWLAANLPTI